MSKKHRDAEKLAEELKRLMESATKKAVFRKHQLDEMWTYSNDRASAQTTCKICSRGVEVTTHGKVITGKAIATLCDTSFGDCLERFNRS